MGELAKNMAAKRAQHLRLVGADIKHLLAGGGDKGVQTYGEDRQFAGTAGGFKQTIRVGIVARRCIRIHIAHAGDVIMIVPVTPIVAHIGIGHPFVIKFT
jgi:hypothetical protein